MKNEYFNYVLDKTTVVFTDSLTPGAPYIAENARDHESLFFVTNGNLLYEKGNDKMIVRKGQIGYISRGSIDKSSAYHCEKVSYIAINFGFSKDQRIPSLPFQTVSSEGTSYNYGKLFAEALNQFLIKTPGYLTICNGIAAQIIGYLYNEYNAAPSELHKGKQIQASMEYLKDNYNNPNLKIVQLSEAAHMSEKNFRRIFSDLYQKTPYKFLQEFRINQAEILIMNTSKSITEISQECGFSDIYSFSHCFKKHTGVSPHHYKQSSK